MTIEPNPINPISWLIILFVGFALFIILAIPVSTTASVQVMPESPSGRPARPSVEPPRAFDVLPARANAEYLSVEKVAVNIRESSPPQVTVSVNGYWSNGCSAEPDIDMAFDGGTVTIAISRSLPPDVMCTMVLQAGGFEIDITDLLAQNDARSGQLTVTVNGVSVGTRFQ